MMMTKVRMNGRESRALNVIIKKITDILTYLLTLHKVLIAYM